MRELRHNESVSHSAVYVWVWVCVCLCVFKFLMVFDHHTMVVWWAASLKKTYIQICMYLLIMSVLRCLFLFYRLLRLIILHVSVWGRLMVRLVLGVRFEDSRWRVGPHGHDSRHKDDRSHRRRRQQPGCVETCPDTQISVSAAAEEWEPRSRQDGDDGLPVSKLFSGRILHRETDVRQT